jgi:predicted MFS family arabinose efflux permease
VPRSENIALSGMAALAVAMGIGRFAFTPILPMMQAESGLSLAQASWLASANYLGYLAGALCAGRFRSARFAIRIALVAIALATLAMGVGGGLAWWLALRFVAGVASAWALVHVSSWCLAELASHRRPTLDGTLFAGVGAGVALAGLACLALMSFGANATQAWLALGALSLVVTAALWRVLGGNSVAPIANAQAASYRWSGEAVRLVACYGAFGFGYIVPATFVPAMARAVIADPRVFGWAWPIFGITAAASTIVAAGLPAKSYRGLWRASAVAMALGVAAPAVLHGMAGIVLASLLVGGTFMVITMAGLQEARRLAGDRAPVLMAAMTSAFAAGQILGPLGVPLIAHRAGFSGALLVAAAVLAMSALFLPGQNQT